MAHLKDLIHICLELEAEDHGITFNLLLAQSIHCFTEGLVKTEVVSFVLSFSRKFFEIMCRKLHIPVNIGLRSMIYVSNESKNDT